MNRFLNILIGNLRWKNFSTSKKFISIFFYSWYGTNFRGNVIAAGWRNHACFMAVQIASKGLSDGTILAFVLFFFVRSHSFERVPVLGVTENQYAVFLCTLEQSGTTISTGTGGY
jgi:hypothetical protein